MENLDRQIKKNGAISGLILGGVLLVLSIFLFYFITTMTTSFWMITVVGPLVFSLLLPIIMAIVLCSDLRKKIGGYWNFRQATTGIFVMFMIAYVVSFGGGLLFSKVIDPGMTDKMKTTFVNAGTTMMEKQHMPQEKIDEQTAKIAKGFDDQKDQNVGSIAQSFAKSILVVFIVSLMFAAFYKNERPLLASSDDEIDATA